MTPDQLLEAANSLTPLLQSSARKAEEARQPLDEVVDAVRATGLFSLMVPEVYGGHEADLDTFFDVVLTLSQADPAMGWLIGFYIEHNYWACGYPEVFQRELYTDRNYILAPATLNPAGGSATKVDGGYQLSGQWQWGTGVLHADWVMAGAIVRNDEGAMLPLFFALPRADVEAIDTWQVMGMCATGSWDMRIDDAFVPDERVAPMLDLMNATGEASRLHDAPLYRTPLMPVLAFAAGLPLLGAAKMALDGYTTQTKAKIAASNPALGGAQRHAGKPSVVAKAALTIDAAELMLRQVLDDVMTQRNEASLETRSAWLTRIAHAVFMCREAVQDISSVTGASGTFLDSPIQRALRDITTASNHVIFDRESRYSDYGQLLLGQPIQSRMV